MRLRGVGWLGLSCWAIGCAAGPHVGPASPSRAAPSSTVSSNAPPAGETFPSRDGEPVPPEVAAMLEPGVCTPRLRTTRNAHWLDAKGDDGRPNRVLLIEPGEKLCLVGSAGLSDLELSQAPVPVSEQAEHLVSVELQVFAFGTVLVVHNGFERALDYRALLRYPGHEPEPTSVCTVQARLSGLEHWPRRVELVALGDFTPLAQGAQPRCK